MSGDYQVFVYTFRLADDDELSTDSLVRRYWTAAARHAQPFAVTRLGQPARFTFTAIANQTLALHTSAISTSQLPNRCHNGSWSQQLPNRAVPRAPVRNHDLRNLAAGTYTVDIDISTAATGSMQLHLVPGVTDTVAADGVGRTYSTLALAQAAYFTFNATAGQNVSFAVTNFSTVPVNAVLATRSALQTAACCIAVNAAGRPCMAVLLVCVI